VKPIRETVEAINELDAGAADENLLAELEAMGARVREIVPECVGISLAYLDHGVTFTLVATDEEIATLDGVQYLSGGPCVDAVKGPGKVIATDRDALVAEEDWQHFAQATAAASIASTLTMPILRNETAIGSVNLYGATGDAFSGHHEAIAEIFHAWAEGAITNADLSFRTRSEAEQAPTRVAQQARIDTATGIIAARQGVTLDTARERLTEAALRAGVTDAQLAGAVIESHSMHPSD
jgi:GAF domain-containing protein